MAAEGETEVDKYQQMLVRLEKILKQFDINIAEANDLTALQDYEMVVIADDSRSMRNPAPPASLRKVGEKPPSRWEELRCTIDLIVDLGSCFDESGLDIYLLNRGKVPKVKSSMDQALIDAFAELPEGGTPLTETLQLVAKECGGEKKVLLFILTDGEPSGEGGKGAFMEELTRLVKKESTQFTFKVQIMICSPDESEVGYLEGIDKDLAEVDVTDDFYTEKVQVLNAKRLKDFHRADWALKAMLGAVNRKFDVMDEGLYNRVQNACCHNDGGSSCTVQ